MLITMGEKKLQLEKKLSKQQVEHKILKFDSRDLSKFIFG